MTYKDKDSSINFIIDMRYLDHNINDTPTETYEKYASPTFKSVVDFSNLFLGLGAAEDYGPYGAYFFAIVEL